MSLNLIWQTVLIFLVGVFLLRIGGRKTLSQMTMPETVIMIALGTLLIQPVAGKGLWVTFVVAAVLILVLLASEYIQLKSDRLETLISGQAVTIIENGKINVKNLSKIRLTVDKLESRLRQVGVAKVDDVQSATLEVNGQLGYQLKPEKQAATKKDIQNLMELIEKRLPNGRNFNQTKPQEPQENIFTEVENKGHRNPPPEQLQ
ncbi:DUF421 domain-containing protein [Aneurinibacillus tyrosinisolvens]|uniref:DUF421 domain-containing protein n=1 Tax=Aneurinibacillus tyrosinisolvens TaxID=1443435 RepID=UPI00063F4AA9|nr:DUF421 domain-containing protein [Aneurinibacillus tyrosinisolvens]